jgi:hypothetical protein
MAFVFAPITSTFTCSSDFDAFIPLFRLWLEMYLNTTEKCTNELAKSRRSPVVLEILSASKFSSKSLCFISLKTSSIPSKSRLSPRLDLQSRDFYVFFILAAAHPLPSLCPSNPLSSTSFELTSRESSPLSAVIGTRSGMHPRKTLTTTGRMDEDGRSAKAPNMLWD